MHFRIRLLCAVLAFALCAALTPVRPGSIAGLVVGPDDEPLKGASVSISGSDRKVTTARDGTFEVTDLPPSHYDVTAELAGYGSARNRVVVDAGKIAKITLKLVPEKRK